MKLLRRGFLQLATGAAAMTTMSRTGGAQNYPSRPLRMLIGFPAGGGADIVGRLVTRWLQERLGQPIVIENRPGAGTNIATEALVRAPADSYSLGLIGLPNAINATLYDTLAFNFIRDVAPVAGVLRTPELLVVHPSVPARTVPELVAYARANPGRINMGSAGNGSVSHVAGELFVSMAGLDVVHVPYRGAAPALTDLLGGRVHMLFGAVTASIPYIDAGKLRLLATSTAARSPLLPHIAAVGEFMPGYEASAWYGIGAPSGTPPAIVERLNAEINAVLADPKLSARLAEHGATPLPGSAADLGKLIGEETEKWAKVIRFAHIKAE